MRRQSVILIVSMAIVLLFLMLRILARSKPRELPPETQKASARIPPDQASKRNRETASVTCRVVAAREDGSLILAGQNQDASAVYRLDPEACSEAFTSSDDEEAYIGSLIAVSFSGLQKTYPLEFKGIKSVSVLPDTPNDLCRLYLRVLNDLWDEQTAINENITELGVSLSRTRLWPSEQNAVAWLFGQAHGIEPLLGTYDELVAQGYIDGGKMFWQNGCLFTITETSPPLKDSVAFDAGKLRSNLGVCFFTGCEAARAEDGRWGDYFVSSRTGASP